MKYDGFDDILNDSAEIVAPRLLGCMLIRTIGDVQLIGKIVETEAYDQNDTASHSYKGNTSRTEVMFGPSGHLYVYFTYGMHFCCNVVCGPQGYGAAVLIRALEPIKGETLMARHRHGLNGLQITNGPAKVCQAMMIDKQLNGHDLHKKPLQLKIEPEVKKQSIVQTTRIGISSAQEKLLRFYLMDSKYVSRPL